MKKRFQIFVSSTYSDLFEEREKTIFALNKAGHIAVGMEQFPSTAESQMDYITKIIEESDYYVVIVRGRYGSTNSDGISYTELEFNYASSIGVPCLAFLYEDIGDLQRKELDDDPINIGKFLEFRTRLEADRIVSYWKTTDELVTKVKDSLIETIRRNPRTGYVRGDQVMDIQVINERERLLRENERLQSELEFLRNNNPYKGSDITEDLKYFLDRNFDIEFDFCRSIVDRKDEYKNFKKTTTIGELFLSIADVMNFRSEELSIVEMLADGFVRDIIEYREFKYEKTREKSVRFAINLRDELEIADLISTTTLSLDNFTYILNESGGYILASRTHEWFITNKGKQARRFLILRKKLTDECR